jgi:hypothetical protein
MQPEERPRTHLFLVRLWVEPLVDNQGEVRMQVRHVLSGETRYFRTWSDLVAFLLTRLPASDEEGREEGGDYPQDGTP